MEPAAAGPAAATAYGWRPDVFVERREMHARQSRREVDGTLASARLLSFGAKPRCACIASYCVCVIFGADSSVTH